MQAYSMLSYSLYIHPTERRLRPFSLSMSSRLATWLLQIGLIAQYAKTLHDIRYMTAMRQFKEVEIWQPTPHPLPRYGICYIRRLLTYKIFWQYSIDIVLNSKIQYRCITNCSCCLPWGPLVAVCARTLKIKFRFFVLLLCIILWCKREFTLSMLLAIYSDNNCTFFARIMFTK